MTTPPNVLFLFTAQAVDANSAATPIIAAGVRGMYGVAQCEITGDGTVTLQGRLDSTLPWKDITAFTSSDAVEVVLFPEIRGVLAGRSTGNVTLAIMSTELG